MSLKGNLSPSQSLQGTLQSIGVLKGELTQVSNLIGEIRITNGTLTGNIISQELTLKGTLTLPSISASGDAYEGSYHVVPLAHNPQTLETKGLVMLGDVVIEKIPYWETSNLSDGYTVYIAEA
jgi:hypothetical protein